MQVLPWKNYDDFDEATVWTSENPAKLFLTSCMSQRLEPWVSLNAPIERVFSYGGLMLKPRWSNMSDKKLKLLIFLKGNSKSKRVSYDLISENVNTSMI